MRATVAVVTSQRPTLATIHCGWLVARTVSVQCGHAGRRAPPLAKVTLSPSVTRQLIAHVTATADDPTGRRAAARRRLDTLTEREREIALALARGCSNAEIAQQTFMSVATVKTYVSRLLTKLDLNNPVQVAILVHAPAWSDPSRGRNRLAGGAAWLTLRIVDHDGHPNSIIGTHVYCGSPRAMHPQGELLRT
ncbi:MAG: response regulator transcription factor [Micromonosporaceae bacterium]|nr:response regulator transcription factor [Micromonosporaceae bacterium]